MSALLPLVARLMVPLPAIVTAPSTVSVLPLLMLAALLLPPLMEPVYTVPPAFTVNVVPDNVMVWPVPA